MRVVIDTNSLIVSIGKNSAFRPIFDALRTGKLKLLVTNEIISEYVEVLEERTTAIVADNIGEFLISSPDVEKVEVHFKWSLITKDPDDNKFVDCALNGRAQFIVTDDRHYRILSKIEFPFIETIRTKAFLELINSI